MGSTRLSRFSRGSITPATPARNGANPWESSRARGSEPASWPALRPLSDGAHKDSASRRRSPCARDGPRPCRRSRHRLNPARFEEDTDPPARARQGPPAPDGPTRPRRASPHLFDRLPPRTRQRRLGSNPAKPTFTYISHTDRQVLNQGLPHGDPARLAPRSGSRRSDGRRPSPLTMLGGPGLRIHTKTSGEATLRGRVDPSDPRAGLGRVPNRRRPPPIRGRGAASLHAG